MCIRLSQHTHRGEREHVHRLSGTYNGFEATFILSYIRHLHVKYSIRSFGFESHPRQLIFLWKDDCLGCVVLLCFVVCLTFLASLFLPSSSFINMYKYMYIVHVHHIHVVHKHKQQ